MYCLKQIFSFKGCNSLALGCDGNLGLDRTDLYLSLTLLTGGPVEINEEMGPTYLPPCQCGIISYIF